MSDDWVAVAGVPAEAEDLGEGEDVIICCSVRSTTELRIMMSTVEIGRFGPGLWLLDVFNAMVQGENEK